MPRVWQHCSDVSTTKFLQWISKIPFLIICGWLCVLKLEIMMLTVKWRPRPHNSGASGRTKQHQSNKSRIKKDKIYCWQYNQQWNDDDVSRVMRNTSPNQTKANLNLIVVPLIPMTYSSSQLHEILIEFKCIITVIYLICSMYYWIDNKWLFILKLKCSALVQTFLNSHICVFCQPNLNYWNVRRIQSQHYEKTKISESKNWTPFNVTITKWLVKFKRRISGGGGEWERERYTQA